MDAELDESSVDDVIQCEDRIVNQSLAVLPPGSKAEIQQEVDEILQRFGYETTLVVIRRANSLALYFICLTLSALMSLRDQWSNGPLKDIVQSLFTVLSSAAHVVRVKRLSWSQTDYDRCVEFFSSSEGEIQL